MRSSGEIATLLGLLVQVVSFSALAQSAEPMAPRGFVMGESTCPSAAEVVRETLRLTPPHRQHVYAEAVRVELQDLGPSYRLRLFEPELRAEKTYVDPGRDCTRRARFAAVFVVLTLMPPEVEAAADRSSSAVTEVATNQGSEAQSRNVNPTTPRANSPTRTRASVDAGVALSWSPPVFEGPELLTPGVLLRGSAYAGAWGAYVAARYHRKAEFNLKNTELQSRRWDFAFGLELTQQVSRWSFIGEVGAVARLQRLRGSGLLAPEKRSAYEFGARLGGRAVVSWGRWGLVAGMFLDGFPSPTELSASPRGILGTTAALDVNSYFGGRVGF